MRRFKLSSINWKYIIGEVVLIFLGINLAIWFNNWNASKKIDRNKKIAIEKIKGEIENNLEELLDARENNTRVNAAIIDYKNLTSDSGNGPVATPSEIRAFQTSYPGFYTIKDSVRVKDGLFRYEGDTYVNLRLSELTEIAWEASKITGIVNEFGYECLYELEAMYSLQRMVQNEMKKATEALHGGEIDKLLRTFVFMEQLDDKLENDYRAILKSIGKCI